MIELVRDLRVINVLTKFENDPWKIMDVRVFTGLVCPAARPPARSGRQYHGALKGGRVKTTRPHKNKTKRESYLVIPHDKTTVQFHQLSNDKACVLSLKLKWLPYHIT